eukprot:261670_1
MDQNSDGTPINNDRTFLDVLHKDNLKRMGGYHVDHDYNLVMLVLGNLWSLLFVFLAMNCVFIYCYYKETSSIVERTQLPKSTPQYRITITKCYDEADEPTPNWSSSDSSDSESSV